jgi:hypothetical protein
MVGVVEQKECASEMAHSNLYNRSHVIPLLIDAWRGPLLPCYSLLSLVLRFCESSRAASRLSRRCYSTQAPKVGVTKTTETEESSDETPTIPPLRRPLGVLDVPTTKTKTLSERTADFLNQEKQLEKRRHLCVALSTWNSVDEIMRL